MLCPAAHFIHSNELQCAQTASWMGAGEDRMEKEKERWDECFVVSGEAEKMSVVRENEETDTEFMT